MPIPKRKKDEQKSDFMSRCMLDPKMSEYEYKQRIAICMGASNEYEQTKSEYDFIIPNNSDYLDYYDEDEEEVYLEDCIIDFDKSKSAEYKGKKVTLNKPFRTPKGPKKFAVYTKNENGNVVIVRFGDPNMEIKRDDPDRRKNFRARHKCESPGPKWKARYWSCKMWESKKSVTDHTG